MHSNNELTHRRSELEKQVKQRYKYDQKLVPSYDRFLFDMPYKVRLKSNDIGLRQWMDDVKMQ